MKVKNYVPGSSQQTQTIRYLTSQVSVISNIQVATARMVAIIGVDLVFTWNLSFKFWHHID